MNQLTPEQHEQEFLRLAAEASQKNLEAWQAHQQAKKHFEKMPKDRQEFYENKAREAAEKMKAATQKP